MSPLTRAIPITLLILLQLLAPWLHAHTGAETGGFLHLPGLERTGYSGDQASCSGAEFDIPGMVVAIQSGYEEQQSTPVAPENELLSQTPWPSAEHDGRVFLLSRRVSWIPPPIRPAVSVAFPRAPPRTNATG